jgi:hypothetical protein
MAPPDDRRHPWKTAFPERRTGDSRRAWPRASVTLVAKGTADSPPVTVSELSVGGLYLEKELDLREGDPVEFELQVPGCDEPVRIVGMIRSRAEDDRGRRGMGIRFDRLSVPDAKVIEAFLDRIARAR